GSRNHSFLSEDDAFDLVPLYIPDATMTMGTLWSWMGKNRTWELNVVLREHRDFTWNGISNIIPYRTFVRATMSSIFTIGYARKSKTKE
ncbi:uncharacterized protein BYT42DRAFT_486985, partial [Radiomyces spectabilis]|uniref:uncharacterized protein n=1 Tax=Radiomyces spectabilis TaxID=64574 RepID=UPI002220D041